MSADGQRRVEEHLRDHMGSLPKGKGICDRCLQAELHVRLEDIEAVGDLPHFDRFRGLCVGCNGGEKFVTRYF
ncbi:MAG TPA: hypothetical protein VFB33_01855 [Candidatus Binataceae bacterium]|jgi:hypothetical protein|nr:hypothetical protein [Candidatus Binataceae bacterium]